MKAEEREVYWRGILGRQEKSGLSIRAFCRQEKMCEQTVYVWRRRLAKKRPMSFAVVQVPAPLVAGSGLELILVGGERLHIAAGVDITTLRTVLTALRERA